LLEKGIYQEYKTIKALDENEIILKNKSMVIRNKNMNLQTIDLSENP
jgi:hypothetical protein